MYKYEKIKGDISNYQDVKKSLEFITTNMPTLKGVIHSAGLLDDASYANMDIDRFLKIYNPKVLGAWNLHQETKDFNLDIFLTISSVSSMTIRAVLARVSHSTTRTILESLEISIKNARRLSADHQPRPESKNPFAIPVNP